MYAEQQQLLDAQQATIVDLVTYCAAEATSQEKTFSATTSAVSKTASASRGLAKAAAAQPTSANQVNGRTAAPMPSRGPPDSTWQAGSDSESDLDTADMESLMRKTEELQRQLEALGVPGAPGPTPQQSGHTLAPCGGNADDDESRIASALRQIQELDSITDSVTEGEEEGMMSAAALRAAPQILATLHALVAEKDRVESQLRQEQADLEQQLSDLYTRIEQEPGAADQNDKGTS